MYKNCSEIPIYNFFELVDKKDFSLLLEEGEKMSDYTEGELYDCMSNIMDEYNSLTNNKRLIKEYQENVRITYMEAKYHITKQLLALYVEYENIEVILTLNRFNWNIKTSEAIIPQIESIGKKLIGLKNQIAIAKASFVKKYKKRYEKTESTPNFDLDKAVVELEVGIPLSYKIDVHKDSIKRFILWSNSLKRKNEALSKKNG